MEIIRGTTPTIEYTFRDIQADEIRQAYLTIIQGAVILERDLSTATVVVSESENKLTWTLTQEETLRFRDQAQAVVYLDWVTSDGTRGAGRTVQTGIAPTGKNEVI